MTYQYNNKNRQYNNSNQQNREQSLRDIGVAPNCDLTARQRFDRVMAMLEGLECEIDYIVNIKKTWWEK